MEGSGDLDGGRSPIGHPSTAPAANGARRRFSRRRRTALRILSGALATVVVAAIVSSLISVPYYAITPGTGLNVGTLITVPRHDAVSHRGEFLLTDVEITPLRALTYVYYRYLDADADVEPSVDVIGPATPNQYAEQGVIDMGNARQAAAVNALRTLGYPIRARPDGVIVYQPFPRSPAASALAVGDVVTALDATPTLTSAALNAAVARRAVGAVVSLRVHRYVARDAVTAPPGAFASRTVRVRLGVVAETRDGLPLCVPAGKAGVPAGAHRPCLGIDSALYEVEQSYATVGAPFAVAISADDIDGPSAGLAFTLGVIEKLDRDDLTGGRRIAATGTMSMGGEVGPVGGVAQKTIAVRAAGAEIFFVPPEEYKVAHRHAGKSLHVYAVSTLSKAISILRSLGGRVARD